MMKLLQGFMKKLWITNKTEFWIEKVTKGKDDKLYVRWKYNLLFELTKKKFWFMHQKDSRVVIQNQKVILKTK